jgi:transcriptional regulator with XRE-family HTH domain
MTATKSLAQIWGEAIRKARTEQGLSIVELAARVGIDPGHLSRGERGLAGIGNEYRISIARALNRSASELFPHPTTQDDDPCPSAANAEGRATSRTPATTAATRSPAPSAPAPAGSDPEGSRAHE